jgi:hypothetical protein
MVCSTKLPNQFSGFSHQRPNQTILSEDKYFDKEAYKYNSFE